MRSQQRDRRRRSPPAPSGGSGRGRRSAARDRRSAVSRSAPVVDRLHQQLLDELRVAPATACARGSPGSSARCSSRSVSRHDGSQPTIGTPRSASGASRAAMSAAIALRLVEQALGDARAPAAAAALEPHAQPAASSSSIAARPIGGLGERGERVGEEHDLAAPVPPARRAAVPADQRLAREARQRAPAVDARDALEQRARQRRGSTAARSRRRAGSAAGSRRTAASAAARRGSSW